MNVFKKLKSIIIVILLLANIIPSNAYALQNFSNQPQINAAVFLNNFDDLFFFCKNWIYVRKSRSLK